jgi:hypothetical protein
MRYYSNNSLAEIFLGYTALVLAVFLVVDLRFLVLVAPAFFAARDFSGTLLFLAAALV